MALDQVQDHPHLSRVTKRLRYESGNPIGRSHYSPIMDSRLYEAELSDGENMSLAENVIAENIFYQVDEQVHRHVIMDEFIDLRTNWAQASKDDVFVTLRYGDKWHKETTKCWQVLVQWKYGITTWNNLKDVKYSYPVQLAEYIIDNGYSDETVFLGGSMF